MESVALESRALCQKAMGRFLIMAISKRYFSGTGKLWRRFFQWIQSCFHSESLSFLERSDSTRTSPLQQGAFPRTGLIRLAQSGESHYAISLAHGPTRLITAFRNTERRQKNLEMVSFSDSLSLW